MKHTTTEKTLKNGIQLLYIDIPGAQSFDMAIAFNSGFRFATRDNIEKYETPHVLEHLVFEGSKAYPSNDELQAVFTAGGGESNGFTTPYHNVFVFHNRARNASEVVAAGLDMVFHPLLSETSYDEEYRVIENELQESMGDIPGNAGLYTLQQILPDFPVSTDTQLARLPGVSYQDALDYHKKYYVTANTIIMLAADFRTVKKSLLEATILASTKSAKKGTHHTFPRFEVATAHPKEGACVPTHKSLTDTVVSVMFTRAGTVPKQDMLALSLFCTIASNLKSYSVNYKLRKQGLIYGLDFSTSESIESHGFELNINADNQKFSEVYATTLSAIRDLAANGISDAQFTTARRDFAESLQDATDSTDAIIGWYLQDYLIDGILVSPDELAKTAARITQRDMLRLAGELFAYDNLFYSVFSAKAIRAGTSVELLTKEVLKHGKTASPELVTQYSLPLGDTDTSYTRLVYGFAAATLLVFALPFVAGVGSPSISSVTLHSLDFPWNILAIILLIGLVAAPKLMQGDELRTLNLQIIGVLALWIGISAAFDWQAFVQPFVSHSTLVAGHAWLFVALLLALVGIVSYGARTAARGWFTRGNKP